jgi:geranylgeranyl pyrophosphate synthase
MSISSISESDSLSRCARAVEPALAKWLADASVPQSLAQAMRYVCLEGGKRLRPALVLLSAQASAPADKWRADPMPAAVAVEMVHCYSLVHDDLPAMDNDVLRRGRPTAHVQFGQAMAILVGDALLTRAFEVLARGLSDGALAAQLAGELAAGAGPAGMIAGQVADMGLCPLPEGDQARRYIHLRKTAALLKAACRMGGLCAGASGQQLSALSAYADDLGLVFQIVDDLLDATASAQALGKTPGKDAAAGKRSYAAELGIEPARRLAGQLTQRAMGQLETFGSGADELRQLTLLLGQRDR